MNGNTDTTASDQVVRIARLAWFATFVVPLVLAALLFGVKSAQGSSPLPGVVPLAFEEEEPEEEGEEAEVEFAAEECEIAEEEAEEGELTQGEVREICDEEDGQASQGANPGKSKHGAARHRAHGHKKACRHKAAPRKRHCPHRSR